MKTMIKFSVGEVWYFDSKGSRTTTQKFFYNEEEFKELTTNNGRYEAYLKSDNDMVFLIRPRWKKNEGIEVHLIPDPHDDACDFLFYCKTIHGALVNLYKRLNTNLESLEDMRYYVTHPE